MEFYMHFQMLQMNMLYVNCVCILKACFKRIDDNLTNLRELMLNNKSYVPRLIYYQQRCPHLLEEIKALRKEYLMVSDTVQKLNIIFSPQVLATITIAFIEITFELYSNTVQWHNGLSISLAKQIHNTILMSYLMYLVTKVMLIVWACETGKNQATKIGTTIHDVLNTTTDEQIKYELQLFSIQILHCNNTFFAKGLTVDAKLLTAMVNSITTYLLILIQFLGTSHSCDGKTTINGTETF
ncbi:PREDICTED: putative gustatory receptor 28b [Wasmannia auropunctata]|uniref:putative gustatory receptor 28b n=1 Tax=Wasmannia auropunctata TaxID=64793 RepID=UPI0005EF01DD|nr:PREDICTED: putative gustatory receptor 28b [Wasmannia auropunctata]